MNFHLLHHRKLVEVLSVPNGLQDLMADIAREVLRYQPGNIECFIADYLESMVLTRELMFVADKTIQDILVNSIQVEQLMRNTGIIADVAISVVRVVEQEFRGKKFDKISELQIVKKLIDECKLNVEEAQKIAAIIEKSWCHYFNQNLRQSTVNFKVNPNIFEGIAANTINYHLNKKSTKICETIMPTEDPTDELMDDSKVREQCKRHESAIIIQKHIRDYKERQKIKKF